MGWLGFWIFMAVLAAVDHWVFTKGYDTLFLGHKTEAEKELQRLIIEERRLALDEGRRRISGQCADIDVSRAADTDQLSNDQSINLSRSST